MHETIKKENRANYYCIKHHSLELGNRYSMADLKTYLVVGRKCIRSIYGNSGGYLLLFENCFISYWMFHFIYFFQCRWYDPYLSQALASMLSMMSN